MLGAGPRVNEKSTLTVLDRVQEVKRQVEVACLKANRAVDEVTILAASKTRSVEHIQAVKDCGITDFGENYLQDATPKIQELSDCNFRWHFIGRIQSNKTKLIAEHFDWVQTVDRISIAERLSRARMQSSRSDKPLNVCIQVNIDREHQKGGVMPDALMDLVSGIRDLPGLDLRGLMAIPRAPAQGDGTSIRPTFRSLSDLFKLVNDERLTNWDTLSMGMSMDFKEAIEEGSTMIRLGTSLFGPR